MRTHFHPHIRHQIVCQHRVEIEVSPSEAEVCFRDERYAQPVDAVVQFTATVFNAPSNRVTWRVLDLNGVERLNAIDAAGLYTAPPKAMLPFSLTEIVVATSVDDPFRQAFAKVAVVGLGPEPKPDPVIMVYPRRVDLYYPGDEPNTREHNEYIDSSNTMQLFRALVSNGDPSGIEWAVDGGVTVATGPEYMHRLSGSGPFKVVHVTATLPGLHTATDRATVSQLNYSWPGIVP
jgi:hypothetical protein